MKYCKRCFRNITEDVAVCPFCKQADKLIDYDKEKRGEDFTCNDDSAFTSHIKSDVYDTRDSEADADNAYGNKKHHNIDNCENSPEAPTAAVPGTPGENFSKLLTYMRTLPAADRQRLVKDTLEDIERRFGPNPDESATVTVYGREISVAQFKRLVMFFGRTDAVSTAVGNNAGTNKNLPTYIAIWVIITVAFPPLGILLGIIAISIYTQNKKKQQ